MANHLKKHSGGHGYTDQDNPFGDSKVNERFVWGKKIEKQIQSGVDVKDLTAKAERRRQEERLVRRQTKFSLPSAILLRMMQILLEGILNVSVLRRTAYCLGASIAAQSPADLLEQVKHITCCCCTDWWATCWLVSVYVMSCTNLHTLYFTG